MRKLKILGKGISLVGFLLIALTGSLVYAEVPHTFSPGTPAKASEVNANFQNLDTRIASLENEPGINGYTLDYKFKASKPGDEITVGGEKYHIIKVAFKTPDGKKYAITHPSASSSGASINLYYGQNLSHDLYGYPFRQTTTINGYPASLYLVSNWTFECSTREEKGNCSQSGYTRSVISVAINEYRIFISLPTGDLTSRVALGGGSSEFPNTTSDFTNVELTLHNDTTLIGYMDELVDYINVEPMQ